ncbi:GDP-mannose 4,6-dehydratase [Planktomarina temperata]|nr:GDP-mannose 4,6-dehydratase [Planktomarina temperata]
MIEKRTAFITGSAGFIGFHVCQSLLKKGFRVIGLDAMTDYYDVTLKQRRNQILLQNEGFTAYYDRLEDGLVLHNLFEEHRPDVVVHLAAQAGVRYSIDNPRSYVQSNLVGTHELLEAGRAFPPEHMLLASTSSVYGANTQMPYAETDKVGTQMSFYAATKKANEAMAHSYSHLFDLPITMFRFFTVYGPWGRPDMAVFKFMHNIMAGIPIDVYNYGEMKRDFTFVSDLVEAICLLIDVVPERDQYVGSNDSLSPVAPWRTINIGNSEPIKLMDFISEIERVTGQTAILNMMEMQAGDVPVTWANTTLLKDLTGFSPQTDVVDGVNKFSEWYQAYYHKK